MLLRTFFLLLAFTATTSIALFNKQTYVIHMDKTMINASDYRSYEEWYKAVLYSVAELLAENEEVELEKVSAQILYVYDTVITGFAAVLSTKELEVLSRMEGFLSATRDEMLTLHTTYSPKFLGLEFGKGLWSVPNMASSDVIIGIADTGIWPEHTSFRDKGMSPVPSRWKGVCEQGTRFSSSNCNRKLIGARAFFKGYEAATGRINETVDYRSARDAQGHGTHTASTAAGNVVAGASFLGLAKGSASGMSYTARIAAYKVCWRFGCSSSDIIAAADQAVADGVDVLSFSLGGLSRPFYSDSVAIASFGAIQNGVFVSCSAGNSGPSRSSVSNTAPWIMTVGASYMNRSFLTTVRLGNGEHFQGSSLYSGKPTKQLPLVYGRNAGGEGAKFCTDGSLSSKLVKGKIVICDRGMNSRTQKGEQVKLAGGAGMLLVNTEIEGEELFADPHILPATSLGESAGKSIKNYVISTKKPRASIAFEGTQYGNVAPVMAAFSSRGPSSVGPYVIKPDVTAPGVNILAAWPPKISPSQLKSDHRSVMFNIISGTSMSCPHVSGLAALVKSVHTNWSPAAIKSALMTTAYTLDNKGLPIGDASDNHSKMATPFAFGSGHVDPERASNPGLIYDITTNDYLNHLCSLKYNSSQIAILAKSRYTCPRNVALHPGDLNYPSFSVIFRGKSVTYKRTVTNVGTPSSTYTVQVNEPKGVLVKVQPKTLEFHEMGEKLSYKVSFVAVGGKSSDNSSFGYLVWVSSNFRVTSPIAVTWT